MVSPRTYGDFELKVDLNIKPGGNSGIQIRSEVTEDGRAVSGYQIEVDTSERRWSGGVYGERFGGWRHNLEGRPKAQAAFRNGGWNTYRIVCEGPRIRSWVNGVPVADYLDADRIEGIIALQVHSGSCDIEWKNIKIIDRGRHEWRAWISPKTFRLGAAARGRPPRRTRGTQVQSNPEYGLLFSTKPWQDFVLSVDCEWTAGNSGVYFRAKAGGFSGITGIQCEVDGRPGRRAAGLYGRPTAEAGCIPRPAKGGPTTSSRAPTATKSTAWATWWPSTSTASGRCNCVTRRWAPKGTLPFSCTVRRMSIWCSRTRRCWSKRRPGRLERINRPLAAKLLFHDQLGIVQV